MGLTCGNCLIPAAILHPNCVNVGGALCFLIVRYRTCRRLPATPLPGARLNFLFGRVVVLSLVLSHMTPAPIPDG